MSAVKGDYGDQYSPDDLARLAGQLSGISGQFILSINDTALSRDLFAGFDIEPVEGTYSVSANAPQRAGELIISNYGKFP